MSIVQNLKLLNKPINELAMLSQETIMSMAQSGQIPVQYVAPILEVKANQAQTGAEIAAMAAQQDMPAGTVLEKLIAQNAANEVKAQMPEDMGIGALPVSEDMVPEFAGGGIVAFQAGGVSSSGIYDGLSDEARAIAKARSQFLGPNQTVADLLSYYEEAEKRAAEQAARSAGMRILEAGLGAMSGESPYALTNIGKGLQPAVKGYGEDLAKQAAADEARRRGKIEAKGMERAEKEKTFGQAMEARKTKFEAEQREKTAAADRASRERVAAMPGETERIAAQIRKEAAANGEKISAEEAARRAKAALTAPPDRYNALSNRLSAANKDIATRTYLLQQQLSQAKTDKEKKAIQNQIDAARRQVLDDYSISPADLAELQAAGRASAPSAPAVAAPAPTAPRSTGFSVTAPDGRTYTFPTQQAADEFRRRIPNQ